jgi:uncharacterized protein YbjT (DUF2867 family)
MADRPQRVFLTGASGFVGTQVLRELLLQGYEVCALLRTAGTLRINDPRVTVALGSILDPQSLPPAVYGCDAAIHLVGIITESQNSFYDVHVQGTTNVVHACRQAGVKRYVHMSAQGVRADAVSNYHKSKWQAEQQARSGAMACTIFRPSLIYGPQGEFTNMLRNWSRGKAPPFFFMPYFGQGFFGQTNPHRISPVYVGDVAQAFVDALSIDRSIGGIYSIGGPEALTWKQMLAQASKAFRGRPKAAIGIPAWLARTMAACRLPGLPFTRDQIIMALEDNATDSTLLLRDFPNLRLHKFEETLNAARC